MIAATEWFELRSDGVGEGLGSNTVALIAVPDWVRLPAEILGTFSGTCPKCRQQQVVHWDLPDRFAIADCKLGCGFVTYRRREP